MIRSFTRFLDNYFGLTSNNTNVRTEFVAGLTTFLAMAYITIVNPSILSQAGMNIGAVFVATYVAAAFGSIAMGLVGRYPVALAPGMGQNAFFTFTIVLGMDHTWQAALGAVFISGIIFVVLSLLPVREWLVNAIPKSLKQGLVAGIGFFLGFIALQNAEIVVDSSATLVSIGDILRLEPMICIFGFAMIVGLSHRKDDRAVIIGILAATLFGWLFGQVEFKGILSMPPSPGPVLLQLDIGSAF
ncbi:MAG: NCS2 family permease, partial [Pseudomonadales bacterium]